MATSQNLSADPGDNSLLTRLQSELDDARRSLDHLQADYDAAVTDGSVIQEDRDAIRASVERARTHHARAADALKRHQSGAYGICERCGGPISPERLEAIPDATTCRDCSG